MCGDSLRTKRSGFSPQALMFASQAHQRLLRRGDERKVVTEMFSYLLCYKEAKDRPLLTDGMWGDLPYARIVSNPRKRSRHVLVDVLTPDGRLEPCFVSRGTRHPKDYRYVRKLAQGDTVAMDMLSFAQR